MEKHVVVAYYSDHYVIYMIPKEIIELSDWAGQSAI
jgi:hypothetical protein